ncbi:MAG: flagellar motor switch protein FliN [Bdellovibrionales bacterium]
MAEDKSNLAAVPDETEAPADEGLSASEKEKMSGIPDTSHRNLSLILDIPLRVAVELGRTKMVVNDLLNLGQGSVIELNKLAGEPMEVLVNDKLVARGEAVVVNEKFGVRLTDIISPAERVEQLK